MKVSQGQLNAVHAYRTKIYRHMKEASKRGDVRLRHQLVSKVTTVNATLAHLGLLEAVDAIETELGKLDMRLDD